MRTGTTEVLRLGPGHEGILRRFFAELAGHPEIVAVFHPHPFTDDAAAGICGNTGQDLYAAMLHDGVMVAYGMLRGWDAGYAIPSLGMAVHPACQSRGLGRAMMGFLHVAARLRGAPAIRLKVYPGNESALRLYRACGYVFEGTEAGQHVGWLRFAAADSIPR